MELVSVRSRKMFYTHNGRSLVSNDIVLALHLFAFLFAVAIVVPADTELVFVKFENLKLLESRQVSSCLN